MKKKRVGIVLHVRMVREVPEDWSKEDIEFFYNESSHCLSRELDDLREEHDDLCTLCNRASVTIDDVSIEEN
jgi:hypothetical protein